MATEIPSERPTMATARRTSPAASQKSRKATNRALGARSRFIPIPGGEVLADDGEVDVLEARPAADLAPRWQPGALGELLQRAQRQQPARRHDADRAGQ